MRSRMSRISRVSFHPDTDQRSIHHITHERQSNRVGTVADGNAQIVSEWGGLRTVTFEHTVRISSESQNGSDYRRNVTNSIGRRDPEPSQTEGPQSRFVHAPNHMQSLADTVGFQAQSTIHPNYLAGVTLDPDADGYNMPQHSDSGACHLSKFYAKLPVPQKMKSQIEPSKPKTQLYTIFNVFKFKNKITEKFHIWRSETDQMPTTSNVIDHMTTPLSPVISLEAPTTARFDTTTRQSKNNSIEIIHLESQQSERSSRPLCD